MKSSSAERPLSQAGGRQNPLEADIAYLRRIAQDPRIEPTKRTKAQKAAEFIEGFLSSGMNYFAKVAEHLGGTRWCQALTDSELAYMLADAVGDRPSRLHNTASEVAASCFRQCDLPSESCVLRLTQWLFDLIGLALATELDRRQQQNEKAGGVKLREILVELREEDRGEQLADLGERLTNGLWLPGDRQAGRQDAASEAVTKIWESVAEFACVSPVAANPKALVAFMTGKLNRVLEHSRDYVRNQIETIARRSEGESSQSVQTEGKNDSKILVEQLASPNNPSETSYRKLLAEQLLSQADLKPKEMAVLKAHYFDERTQKEIAETLVLSQPEVSKTLKDARDKLKRSSNSVSNKKARPKL